MKRRRNSYWLMLLALPLLANCAGVGKFARHERVAGIEPSVRPIQPRPYRVLGKAQGMASSFSLFYLSNVTPKPEFNRTMQEMIQSKGGDDLIEVYYVRHYDYWFIGGVNQLHIYGKVIKYEEDE